MYIPTYVRIVWTGTIIAFGTHDPLPISMCIAAHGHNYTANLNSRRHSAESQTLDATGTQRLLRPQARLQCFIKDKDRSHVLGSSVVINQTQIRRLLLGERSESLPSLQRCNFVCLSVCLCPSVCIASIRENSA